LLAREQPLQGFPKILRHVPAVDHLDRVWRPPRRAVTIHDPPIAGDHRDPRVRPQPGDDRLGGAVGQEIDRPATLQVHDHGAIALAFAPGPVVDRDDARQLRGGQWRAMH